MSVLVQQVIDYDDDRFLDMMDELEEDFSNKSDLMDGSSPHGSSHGPWRWNERLSTDLQSMVDKFCNINSLRALDFSMTIADPSQPDCPLVACSAGFTELTGYEIAEIVGRNCRFLLNNVPEEWIDEETRFRSRDFCMHSSRCVDYGSDTATLPQGMRQNLLNGLPRGELLSVQTNATKSGELFRNMFYMKQVDLDDQPYIIGLQSDLPEEFDVEADAADLEKMCQAAFGSLSTNMSVVEQVFAQRFWYSAPMRRQN